MLAQEPATSSLPRQPAPRALQTPPSLPTVAAGLLVVPPGPGAAAAPTLTARCPPGAIAAITLLFSSCRTCYGECGDRQVVAARAQSS